MLVKQCGMSFLSTTHHANLEHMPLLKEHPEPVYTLIRNPYDYILSRYNYEFREEARRNDEVLEKYISKYSLESHSSPFGSIMCMYRNYVDKYFLFEDGPKAFFDAVGFPDVDVGKIGMRSGQIMGERLKIEDVPPVVKELIDHHFAEELALYKQVKEKTWQRIWKEQME